MVISTLKNYATSNDVRIHVKLVFVKHATRVINTQRSFRFSTGKGSGGFFLFFFFWHRCSHFPDIWVREATHNCASRMQIKPRLINHYQNVQKSFWTFFCEHELFCFSRVPYTADNYQLPPVNLLTRQGQSFFPLKTSAASEVLCCLRYYSVLGTVWRKMLITGFLRQSEK